MANPVAIAMAKIAADLANDKKVRTFIASVTVGLILIILIPLLAVVALFNHNAGYMEDMIEAFEQLDMAIEEAEELDEEGLDDIKIKSFFYILYFSKDLSDFDDAFYSGLVECFLNAESDEEAAAELESFLPYSFTEQEREEINSLYLFIKYGYAVTDKVTGIPGEAFNDETFVQLMGEATKYIGFPYVWGGSRPSTSFDCSGFVCWSFTQSGVKNLPRTTAQGIYNQCMVVSKEELKPGDLVFFTGTYQSNNPVTHIGIFVGDNQMIHCGDPIGYANLSNSYWIKHFYGYGRFP